MGLSVVAPLLWNFLPLEACLSPTLSSFRKLVKMVIHGGLMVRNFMVVRSYDVLVAFTIL